jgi:hypothetical protein
MVLDLVVSLALLLATSATIGVAVVTPTQSESEVALDTCDRDMAPARRWWW